MESSAYPMLFSPIKVGTTEVKNRVFMPPVSTNLADHGYVTDDLVDHYRARAKGGVGLIITEVVTVEPTYTYLPGDMWKSSPRPSTSMAARSCRSSSTPPTWPLTFRARRA
jgi:2,4-dienoyl-CoA reductase-like NADH-dependent reductase (Old Yellow Enzyme family)